MIYHHIVIGSFESTDGKCPTVDSGKLGVHIWKTEKYYLEKNKNATVAWGKLYRKEYYRDIRYPVGKIHEDEFVTYRLLFKSDEVAVIDQPLYAYYRNPSGIMGSAWSAAKLASIDAIKEQIGYFGRRKIRQVECFCKRRYVLYASLNIKRMQEKSRVRFCIRKIIVRGKLKKALIQYRKDVPFTAENLWFYDTAFPIGMFLYWQAQGIRRKIALKKL